ncbi:MAG: ABC transporter transmembrane domain-containing protein [Phycisphaerae bacterium]|nr:ABC transporter transmembrane domain-containing protein [Phycisphaerae bacterium]
MKAFNRIFKYILPQWPRIVVVVISAILVSILLSLSFMTVIPLLKVMMNEEGLHGWVDRKSCNISYGLDFYVPNITDVSSTDNQDIINQLQVTKVTKGSIADAAGLKVGDRIIEAGNALIGSNLESNPVRAPKLLQELATVKDNLITLKVKRFVPDGMPEVMTMAISTAEDTAYIDSLGWSGMERMKFNAGARLMKYAQLALSRLPREQSSENQTKAIMFLIIGVGIITVIRCLAKYYQSFLAEKVVQVGINHLRRDAFEHVLNMPMGFFANERPSDTVSRLVRDTGAMGNGIKIMLGKALREPLNAAAMLGMAAYIDWKLTLIFLGGAPPTLWLAGTLGRKMKRASRKSLVAWSQMLAKLQETMESLKVVKVYNQQKYEKNIFEHINQSLLKQLLRISSVDAATQPVLEVLGMAAGSVALLFGASWVAQKKLEGPEFLALLILLGAAAEAVRKTSDIWNKIQEANAAAERVFSIMDQPLEPQKEGAVEMASLKNTIVFKDIVFSYPGSERPVLNGINLSVKAGHNIALVGPNGSGKTTLANLLPRFYDPDSGQVFIDGEDIRDATLFSLRSQIGMVTQNVVTFNDTIAANIAYGKPGASREEIVAAAERAFAHEFISPLPNGYDTIIGEQGAGLSGGQLQRIVIARAILRNPAILIFDEATSQVDADSEAKIHQAIEEIMHDRTCFIIAHRFSTIISADVIVVMDKGKIIAQGQHEKLMQSCSLYQSLYETQMITLE